MWSVTGDLGASEASAKLSYWRCCAWNSDIRQSLNENIQASLVSIHLQGPTLSPPEPFLVSARHPPSSCSSFSTTHQFCCLLSWKTQSASIISLPTLFLLDHLRTAPDQGMLWLNKVYGW